MHPLPRAAARAPRPPSRAFAPAVITVISAIALPACAPEVTCSSEVIDGSGTFRATAAGRKPQAEIEREAVRAACGKLCAARSAADDACVSRCTVDVSSAKIGARTTCGGAKAP